MLKRLRLADGEPMGIQTAHIPVHLAPGLDKEKLDGVSLYALLQTRYGLDDVQMLQRMKHLADARGITLKMAALEVQGGLPAPSAPAEGTRAPDGPGVVLDESPWRAAADLLPQSILLLETSGRIADANVAFARVKRAEMVRAFIESGEYRQRFFGAPGGNQDAQEDFSAWIRNFGRTIRTAIVMQIVS